MLAKKHFGQNFLKDSNVLNQIIQAVLEVKGNLNLVEIGVGLGDLSLRLLEIDKLKAYEIDSELCSFISQKFNKEIQANRLNIILNDVLKVEPIDKNNGWLDSSPYLLVSNLPYYVATRIIINALKDSLCKAMVVMTQKEVALKFCAESKNSEFCALSVLAQSVGESKFLFEVGKESFTPAPKVTSAVFLIKKLDSGFDITDEFESFLKMAFSQPRKKLIKNLNNSFNKEKLESTFRKLGLDINVRAHEVTTKDFHQIYNILKDTHGRK